MRLASAVFVATLLAVTGCGGADEDESPVSETIEELDEAAGVDTLKPDDATEDPDPQIAE